MKNVALNILILIHRYPILLVLPLPLRHLKNRSVMSVLNCCLSFDLNLILFYSIHDKKNLKQRRDVKSNYRRRCPCCWDYYERVAFLHLYHDRYNSLQFHRTLNDTLKINFVLIFSLIDHVPLTYANDSIQCFCFFLRDLYHFYSHRRRRRRLLNSCWMSYVSFRTNLVNKTSFAFYHRLKT